MFRILVTLFFCNSIFACPNLAGTYVCSDKEFDNNGKVEFESTSRELISYPNPSNLTHMRSKDLAYGESEDMFFDGRLMQEEGMSSKMTCLDEKEVNGTLTIHGFGVMNSIIRKTDEGYIGTTNLNGVPFVSSICIKQ